MNLGYFTQILGIRSYIDGISCEKMSSQPVNHQETSCFLGTVWMTEWYEATTKILSFSLLSQHFTGKLLSSKYQRVSRMLTSLGLLAACIYGVFFITQASCIPEIEQTWWFLSGTSTSKTICLAVKPTHPQKMSCFESSFQLRWKINRIWKHKPTKHIWLTPNSRRLIIFFLWNKLPYLGGSKRNFVGSVHLSGAKIHQLFLDQRRPKENFAKPHSW